VSCIYTKNERKKTCNCKTNTGEPCIPVKIIGDAGLLDGGYTANKRAVENSSSVSFVVVSPGDDAWSMKGTAW